MKPEKDEMHTLIRDMNTWFVKWVQKQAIRTEDDHKNDEVIDEMVHRFHRLTTAMHRVTDEIKD